MTPVVVRRDVARNGKKDHELLLWVGVDSGMAVCVEKGGPIRLVPLEQLRVWRPNGEFPLVGAFAFEDYAFSMTQVAAKGKSKSAIKAKG